MVANIARFNGRAAMMYAGARPWHGLGISVEGEQTAENAIKLAGLDWEVDLHDVFLHDLGPAFGSEQKANGYKAVVRRDTGAILNILGDGFTPVQNREAFKFFDAVVGEGQAIYHTAGALGNGERVWMLAKVPGSIMVEASDGKDSIEKYLLLANGHDGSLAFRMLFTPVRVVCQNTLTMALGSTEGLALRHTESIDGKIAEARRALGIVIKKYDDFSVYANRLAETPIAKTVLRQYVEEVFPARKGEKLELVQKRVETVEAMFEELPTNNVGRIGGTYWAAYNAATEFVDWGGKDDRATMTSSRLRSTWMGAGAATKNRALETAIEMAGVSL